jgi:hypothetical protein
MKECGLEGDEGVWVEWDGGVCGGVELKRVWPGRCASSLVCVSPLGLFVRCVRYE